MNFLKKELITMIIIFFKIFINLHDHNKINMLKK